MGASPAPSGMEGTGDHAETATALHAEATVPALTIDVAVPKNHLRVRHVSLAYTQTCARTRSTPVQSAVRTAKVAITLGRALVTTVGAVMDSLVSAAVDATTRLV